MRRWLTAGVLAACLVASGSAQSGLRLGAPNWDTWAPREPFVVHRYYTDPYNQVIYIADVVYLHDGAPMLAVENIRGRWCKYGRGCLIPAETKRATFVEVEATIGGPTQE